MISWQGWRRSSDDYDDKDEGWHRSNKWWLRELHWLNLIAHLGYRITKQGQIRVNAIIFTIVIIIVIIIILLSYCHNDNFHDNSQDQGHGHMMIIILSMVKWQWLWWLRHKWQLAGPSSPWDNINIIFQQRPYRDFYCVIDQSSCMGHQWMIVSWSHIHSIARSW